MGQFSKFSTTIYLAASFRDGNLTDLQTSFSRWKRQLRREILT
jgi:hypothetical protein